MKLHKRIIDSLIILTGPAGTTILYVGGEAGNIDAEGVVRILFSALGLMVVAVLVSVLIHSHISQFRRVMWVSVICSEPLYVGLLVGFILILPEGRGRAESIMWLPIMVLFLIPFALPTAWSVSYGIGRIVSDIKRGRMVAARDNSGEDR